MSGRGGAARARAGAAEPPLQWLRADDGREYRLRVERATVPEPPPDVEHVLDEAYIPLFLWRSVPVVMQRQKRISIIERFALEAAEELRSVTADELADLTALPRRAIAPLLRRLLTAGALDLTETDCYTPTAETYRILTTESVTVLETTTQDFAYFPHTDELLVLTDTAAPWRGRLLHPRMRPILQMPVEEPLCRLPRSEVINRHLTDKTAHWRPEDLFRAVEPEDEEPVGELCPVLMARPALCRFDEARGRRSVELTFRGRAARKNGDRGGGRAAGGAEWSVRVALTGVDRLIKRWSLLTDMVWHPDLAPALWRAVAGDDAPVPEALTVDEDLTPRYTMWLPEAAVLELHRRTVPLNDEVGLRVRDEEAALLVRLELRPADGDEGAAALFALDYAAQLLGAAPSMGYRAALDEAAVRFGLAPGSDRLPGPAELLERMWRLELYEAVYALRESDDFHYV